MSVLRSVADVAGLGTYNIAEPVPDRRDGGTGVVHTQRCLSDVGYGRIGGDIEPSDIVLALNEMHLALELAHRSLDLGMPGMTDQDQDAALVDIALALVMDLRNERADRVQHRQASRLGIHLDGTRHPMGAENRHRAWGHFGKVLHEASPFSLKALDDMAVVHYLVAHIDGRAEFIERPLHDLNCSDNAGTEAARLR